MATAQNGWPVVTSAPDFVVDGVHFPNGVLGGDAQIVFRWLVRQYGKRVENVVAGWCWGFDRKKITGTDVWSCHAAALAIDINAPRHNQGTKPSASFSARQIDECHALERESNGVLRWGGDFSNPDGMHWEVVGTPAQLHTLAVKITKESTVADATLSAQTKADIGAAVVTALNTVDGVFRSPSWRGDQANTEWPFEDVFTTVYERNEANQQAIMADQAFIKTQLATILSAIADLTP